MFTLKNELVGKRFKGFRGTTITLRKTGIWIDFQELQLGIDEDDDLYVRNRLDKSYFYKFEWLHKYDDVGFDCYEDTLHKLYGEEEVCHLFEVLDLFCTDQDPDEELYEIETFKTEGDEKEYTTNEIAELVLSNLEGGENSSGGNFHEE